jgi:hypothetical protein
LGLAALEQSGGVRASEAHFVESCMKKILAVIAHEVREAIPAFLFFLTIFALGRITQALLLEEYHITVGGTAVAAIGALIVAKAVLVADALPLTNIFADRMLVRSIVWKSVIYGLITFAFRYLEELVPLVRKYGGIAAAHERLLEEVSWPHFWAVQLWIAFSLVLFCAGVEFIRVIGKDRVLGLLFGASTRAN